MSKNSDWSDQEDNLLIQYYPLESKQFLCNLFPARSWNGIKQHAYGKLKLKKEITGRTVNGNLSPLLEETTEAYYWMGFLLADGSFDKNGRIALTVSEKDIEQLKKFGNFINTSKIISSTRTTNYMQNAVIHKISCYSKYYGTKLIQKFNLKLNKTENPPEFQNILNNTSAENFMSLIIGFIDGDGSITFMNKGKNTSINIEIHSSWLKNLEIIENFIYSYFNESNPDTAKINANGYAKLSITRTSINKKLKLKSKQVPAMDRKWSRIKL